MLSDFLHTILGFIEYLWPLKVVHAWERGLYLVNGRVVQPWGWVAFRWRALEGVELGPGVYLALPFFTSVHQVAVSWDYVDSGRLDLTLKSGDVLSCEATAKMRVVDLQAAYIGFHDYEHDRTSALRAAISETLVEAGADRFEPGKRGRLLGGSLLNAVREAAGQLGHEVELVQVTTFVLRARVLRLLN